MSCANPAPLGQSQLWPGPPGRLVQAAAAAWQADTGCSSRTQLQRAAPAPPKTAPPPQLTLVDRLLHCWVAASAAAATQPPAALVAAAAGLFGFALTTCLLQASTHFLPPAARHAA